MTRTAHRAAAGRTHRRALAALASMAFVAAAPAAGQQLEPGAYTPAPVGINVLVVSNTLQGGDLAFDPSGPIEDASATINVSAVGYVRSLGLWGRSANVGVVLPYLLGNLEGLYLKAFQKVHRSGLGDAQVRLAVNLGGAPAMTPREFADYRPRTVVGVSLTTVVPLGQYGGSKLINIGSNRWSFKPEIGITHTAGPWRAEVFLGVWLFTDNHAFAGGRTREQDPILTTQFHLTRTFRRGLWAAFNANFYTGGRTTIAGVSNVDLQRNSRVGATVAFPVARAQSLKIAYSRGAYTTIGAEFDSLGVSYTYAWR
jgi:hypothetical protein